MATVAGQVFANVHLLTKNPERGSVWRVDSLIATRITASRPPLHSAHLTTTFCIYCIFGSSLSLSRRPVTRSPSGNVPALLFYRSQHAGLVCDSRLYGSCLIDRVHIRQIVTLQRAGYRRKQHVVEIAPC